MLNHPTSSPMMTRILGFCCCGFAGCFAMTAKGGTDARTTKANETLMTENCLKHFISITPRCSRGHCFQDSSFVASWPVEPLGNRQGESRVRANSWGHHGGPAMRKELCRSEMGASGN